MALAIEAVDATMNAAAGSTSLLLNGGSVTGAGNGDLLIIGLAFHDHTVTNVAISAGKGTWTQLATEVATGDHLLQVWRCIVTNSAGANPSVTWTTTSKLETICYRIGGEDQTTPMDVNESEANGNSSTITAGSITLVSQRSLLIMFASQGGSGAVGKFSSWSSPLTEDVENGDGANITIASASSGADRTPGATGAKSTTSVQSQPWAAVLCAVRPAAETFNQAVTVTQTPSVLGIVKALTKSLWIGQDLIRYAYTVTGGLGNNYIYADALNTEWSNYVFQSGDHVEYDLWWEQSDARAAIDFSVVGGTPPDLRGTGLTDGQGIGVHSDTAIADNLVLGKWYHRKFGPIPADWVGRTLTRVQFAGEQNANGTYAARYKAIQITDGAGGVRKTFFNGGINVPNSESNLKAHASNSYILHTGPAQLVPVVIKSIGRIISISRASTLTVATVQGRLVVATVGNAVTMVRQVGLVRLITQAPALTYVRDLAITLAVTAGNAIAIVRSRLITIAAQSTTVVLPVLFGYGKVVTALQGAVVALQRAISKIIPVEQVSDAVTGYDRSVVIPTVQQAVQVTNEVTDARLFQVGTDVVYAEGQPGVEIGHDTGSYIVEVASEEAREHWELSEAKDAATWEIS